MEAPSTRKTYLNSGQHLKEEIKKERDGGGRERERKKKNGYLIKGTITAFIYSLWLKVSLPS